MTVFADTDRPPTPGEQGIPMHINLTRILSACVKGAVLALVAAVIGGCGTTEDQTRKPPEEHVETLELTVENTQYEALDLGRAGASLGDMDVYSGNAIRDGNTVGQGGGTCQTVHVEGDEVTMQCSITMELEHGSLTMQSIWRRGASPLDMAVTGGTGEYRNARGIVRFWDIATPHERVRAEIVR